MPQEYQPSGALGSAGLKVPLGWFCAISLPMALDGWVDGVFGNYIGVGFLSLLLAVLVSGAAAGFLARWSHCRSPAFLVKAGLVVVTLGYGVNWAVFLSNQPELGDHRVLTFLLNPMNAYTGLAHVLTTESYAWFGWTPPAALRVIAWLLEFLVWLGLGGLWAGRNALNRKFYSEKRQCFAISEEPTLFLSLSEDKDYREALMQGEFLDGKLEVVRVGPEFPASFAVCVQRCREYSTEAAVHLALRLNQGGKVKQQDVSPLYLLDAMGEKALDKIARQAEWVGKEDTKR